MFLSRKKVNGVHHLLLIESVYDKERQGSRPRVIEDYGPYEEAPEELRRKFEDAKARRELSKQLAQEKRAKAVQAALGMKTLPAGESLADAAATHFNKALALHYGHIPLRGIWDRELGLRYKLDYLQKTASEIKTWRVNDLLFYLCATKVLSPKSYLQASETKSSFLYCPWNGIAQDNFYKCLDFVFNHREELIHHAARSRIDSRGEDVKVAFFDCTNTWFETPYDDVTWQTIHYTQETVARLSKKGKTNEEINEYLSGADFAEDMQAWLEKHKDDVIRMRGPSKEGRFSQPLVSVALAIDQTGFPIDCKVFAGNTSEKKAIKPVLDSLKEKYHVTDVYFVADRGLNSAEALEEIKKKHLGYVVAQQISKQKDEIRKEMLDLTGYRNCRINDAGDFEQCGEKELDPEAFRFKVCDYDRSSRVDKEPTEKDPRKSRVIKLSDQIIYTFSPERKARDLADLEVQIAKAEKVVNEHGLMGNPSGSGWRALVKTKKEAAQNKKDKDQYRAEGLKEDVIANRKEIAGYAAVVFSHPDIKGAEKLTAEGVLKTYHRLVGIEDCFRVMKSSFSIRPVYVRLRERIEAHCYLCVLSLMMLRLLQEKLEKSHVHMSSPRICQALADARVIPIPTTAGEQMFLNLGGVPDFHAPERIGKKARVWGVNETIDPEQAWGKYKEEREAKPDDIDQILLAVGLKPLALYSTMGNLKTSLGLKSVPREDMLAPECVNYCKQVAMSS